MEQATRILQASDGEVKTAIVAVLANVSPAVARQRLQETGGFVRKAIG
jgi:N-acetylmuramic acid 6-phosphate (MurNAc-6-P) etherase